ncbi:MAG: PQQ-binding-like beta-propeller repeat protein [Planctomycetota bacterium]
MPFAPRFFLASTASSLRAASVSVAALVLAAGVAEARIVPRQTAQMAGLTRAWYTQAAIDTATQTVTGAVVQDGAVYVLSSAGTLQAFDAETGAVSWTARLGERFLPVYGPTVHRTTKVTDEATEVINTRCAITVGSALHVVDADSGALVFTQKLDGAPAAAPALGDKYAFVANVAGRLTAYPTDPDKGVSFSIASPGLLDGAPVLSDGRVIWRTARGEVYAASAETRGPSYRFDAAAPLTGAPVTESGQMYFATNQGVVQAMTAEKARSIWRTSVGGKIHDSVIIAAETVYVACDEPRLYALDAASGRERWRVEGLDEFVSASEDRVYAVAPSGALGVLERQTGRPLASWPSISGLTPVPNTQTDRLYFISAEGLLQCFHEEGRDKPYRHDGMVDEPETPAADTVAEEAPAVEAEEDAVDPFAVDPVDEPADEPVVDEGFDPFAPSGDTDDAADDDPFADF